MFGAEPITVAGPCRIYTDLPRYSARKLNYGAEAREWSLVGQAKAGHGLNRIQGLLPRRSVGSSRRRLVFHRGPVWLSDLDSRVQDHFMANVVYQRR